MSRWKNIYPGSHNGGHTLSDEIRGHAETGAVGSFGQSLSDLEKIKQKAGITLYIFYKS